LLNNSLVFSSNKKQAASYLWSKGIFVSSERRASHSPLTAAAFSCCRHSRDPWFGGGPGGRSGHASGSSPQVRALPGVPVALISSAKWLVKLNSFLSHALWTSVAVPFHRIRCCVLWQWGSRLNGANFLFPVKQRKNYCMFSLYVQKLH